MFAVRKLSKRETVIASLVALVIAGALTYNTVIEPLATRWQRLDSRIRKKASDLRKDMNILSRGISESDYEKFSVFAGAGKSEEEDISDTLTLIESVCRANSCRIASIRPGNAKTSGRTKEIMIDVDIESSFGSLFKFLYEIEAKPEMALRVNRFTINSTAGSGGRLKCALSIARILAL